MKTFCKSVCALMTTCKPLLRDMTICKKENQLVNLCLVNVQRILSSRLPTSTQLPKKNMLNLLIATTSSAWATLLPNLNQFKLKNQPKQLKLKPTTWWASSTTSWAVLTIHNPSKLPNNSNFKLNNSKPKTWQVKSPWVPWINMEEVCLAPTWPNHFKQDPMACKCKHKLWAVVFNNLEWCSRIFRLHRCLRIIIPLLAVALELLQTTILLDNRLVRDLVRRTTLVNSSHLAVVDLVWKAGKKTASKLI